jgi:hypothetical protein
MIIKAISVKQPWASRIRDGKKTIETRNRRTNYRGPLLICASKGADGDGGCTMALCRLADCRPMTPADAGAARCQYLPGLWAWVLENVRPVDRKPVRGMPGFFKVDVPDKLVVELLNDYVDGGGAAGESNRARA